MSLRDNVYRCAEGVCLCLKGSFPGVDIQTNDSVLVLKDELTRMNLQLKKYKEIHDYNMMLNAISAPNFSLNWFRYKHHKIKKKINHVRGLADWEVRKRVWLVGLSGMGGVIAGVVWFASKLIF